MSYILDALRRADSERERGAVPSLHSRQASEALADADDDEGGERKRFSPLVWTVIGLLVLLIAVLAWQLMGTRSPEPSPLPTTVAVVPAPTPGPVAGVEPVAPPPPTQPVQPAQPAQPAPMAAANPPSPAPPLPAQRKPARPAAKPSAPAPVVAAAPDKPVSTYNDLPENIRRELPQLVIGGAMYSQTPANRMLILNGQVFHEGDKVAGELVLEQIKLKSAVLAYKGYRYGINY